MNAQAGLVEADYQRPIMSSFHGLFSLGGLTGAALASIGIWLGVGASRHLLVMALVSMCAVGTALPRLVPSRAAEGSRRRVLARPTRALLGLGVLAFLALLAEGAM